MRDVFGIVGAVLVAGGTLAVLVYLSWSIWTLPYRMVKAYLEGRRGGRGEVDRPENAAEPETD